MPKKIPNPKDSVHLAFAPEQQNRGRDMRRYLRRKENFACVRIFYWGSRRKTEDLDVTGIRRERTRN